MTEKQKARVAVLTANFFFGTSAIAVKHITPAAMSAFALTAIRIGVTTALFWSLFAARPEKMGITRKDYFRLVLCAIAGITLNQTFTMKGMSLTSPIHASLLILTTPVTITVLASFFLKESLTFLKIAGLLLGITGGVLLVFSRDISTMAGMQESLGDLFVFLGALGYSTYVIMVRPLIAKYRALNILQWVFLFGACMSVPLGWKDLTLVNWIEMDFLSWFSLSYIVFGATFLAYQFMNYGISKLGASITSSFIYTQPFFATIASMLLLHERLTSAKIAAAILIMLGVFLTNYKRRLM